MVFKCYVYGDGASMTFLTNYYFPIWLSIKVKIWASDSSLKIWIEVNSSVLSWTIIAPKEGLVNVFHEQPLNDFLTHCPVCTKCWCRCTAGTSWRLTTAPVSTPGSGSAAPTPRSCPPSGSSRSVMKQTENNKVKHSKALYYLSKFNWVVTNNSNSHIQFFAKLSLY